VPTRTSHWSTTDATPENLAARRANGFSFIPYAPTAFRACLDRCLDVYRHQPEPWRQLQQTGMHQDWSWQRSAAAYEELYAQLLREI
jgi:starch synthase